MRKVFQGRKNIIVNIAVPDLTTQRRKAYRDMGVVAPSLAAECNTLPILRHGGLEKNYEDSTFRSLYVR